MFAFPVQKAVEKREVGKHIELLQFAYISAQSIQGQVLCPGNQYWIVRIRSILGRPVHDDTQDAL